MNENVGRSAWRVQSQKSRSSWRDRIRYSDLLLGRAWKCMYEACSLGCLIQRLIGRVVKRAVDGYEGRSGGCRVSVM